jgi:hypothetical protein
MRIAAVTSRGSVFSGRLCLQVSDSMAGKRQTLIYSTLTRVKCLSSGITLRSSGKRKDVVWPGWTSHEAEHPAVSVRSPRPQGEVRRRLSFANGGAFTAPGFKEATILVTLGEASVAGGASEGVAASAQSSVFFTLARSLSSTFPPSSLCFAAAKRVRAPSWYRACRTSLHSSDPGRARCMPL